MKRLHIFLFTVAMGLMATTARAELTIEITQGSDDPASIAVVPFAWQGNGAPPADIAEIVDSDLARSGQFAPVARVDMLGRPTTETDIFYRDWRAINAEYLLIGRASGVNPVRVDYELYDVLRQTRILTGSQSGPPSEVRMVAHRVADAVYEKLTGVPGAFATKLLYITVDRQDGGGGLSRLTLSDSDGASPVVLLKSGEPLLTPTWSPDARHIAYVSFESGRPAIYRQELATGKRQQLTNFKGLNSSPAWSPDGRSMAMVLSKGGNPDIYLMDLASGQLKQLTRHYAIDTEPTWMPDGNAILFTSDRGGKPQIYRYDLRTGATDRVTFEGSYNARPRISQDGRSMVMVHRQEGRFYIALQDLVTNRVQILTQTDLDESPSIAPNGSMVLYATKQAGRGILAAVAVDGAAKFSLPARQGDVREPAWSPYLYR
ncbi:MAG: Tol-Pal system beta propeller repeat protein TolB [Halioglobus sp.]|nr:Tol-Pal system beta propeller repeat protein TolB [Halioglobus sp.]